mgnify:CR=1 FL=1
MATIEERLKAIEEKLGIEQKPVAGWKTPRNDENRIFSIAYTSDGKRYDYGFNLNNEFIDIRNSTGRIPGHLVSVFDKPADPKEVEQRMIEEAKRRGFKKGVKFNCLFSGLPRKVNNLIHRIDHFHSDRVLDSDIGLIFNKGQWAEIIEEPLTLNGKEVDYDESDDTIRPKTTTNKNRRT